MKSLFFFCLFSLVINPVISQDTTPKSIFSGLGPAFAVNTYGEGFGYNMDFGFQSTVWKSRLRQSTSISFSSFNNLGVTDSRDLHFSSAGLKSALHMDIFKIRNFSPFIGLGGSCYLINGLLGTGGWPPGNNESTHFRDVLILVDITAGLRLFSNERKVAYELRLFDVSTNFALNDELLEAAVLNLFILIKLE